MASSTIIEALPMTDRMELRPLSALQVKGCTTGSTMRCIRIQWRTSMAFSTKWGAPMELQKTIMEYTPRSARLLEAVLLMACTVLPGVAYLNGCMPVILPVDWE